MRHALPVAAFAVALTAAPIAARADLAEIVKAGHLRAIVADGEQPEMFDIDGDPAKPGLEREMLEGFARVNRVQLDVVMVKTFSERIPALLRGDGDVVVGLVDTPERRRQVAFTAEVLPVRHVVVTHKPHAAVKSVEELRARKTGSIRGTSWAQETAAAGVPEGQTEFFADTDPLLEALAAGRIDAAVMSVSDFALAANRRPGLEAGVAVGAPGRAGWGVRKQDLNLKAELDRYLANVRSGPSWNRLLVVYFGDQAVTVLGRGAK
jgi:ABC-type amino acid transport substrate-binding protein